MNICRLSCYRSSNITLISTLILFVISALLVEHGHAKELYEEQREFSEAELAQLLAPVALYPDSLLTHILIASTYPLQIVQANRWRSENHHLSANQAMKKAENKNWDPSVIALLAFPNLLDRLDSDLEWTQKLGNAFLDNEAALLAAIQSLRRQADQADSLSEMDNLSVIRTDRQIIIEPIQKGVVYIPCYDPLVVYGHWHWYSHPPVSWCHYPYYVPRSYGLFYWSHGIHITFNYYFSAFNWHKQHIVVVSHQNSNTYRSRDRIATSRGAQRWKHKYPYKYRRESHNNHLRPEVNSNSPGRMRSGRQRDNTVHRLKKYTDNHRKIYNNNHFHYPNQQRGNEIEEPLTDNIYPLLPQKPHKAEQGYKPLRGEIMRPKSSDYREQNKVRDREQNKVRD